MSHAPSESNRPARRSPWGRVLVALCIAQFGLLIALSIVWNRNEPVVPAHSRAPGYSATKHEPFFVGNPGPWGELEFARINIEPPDEFIPLDGKHVFSKTRWFFPEFAADQLQGFLESCELTPAQKTELINRANWAAETNGIVVAPSDALVLQMSPAARARIYAILAKSDRNEFHFWPYTYRSAGFDDWFGKSGLSDKTVASLKSLVYQRGQTLCFSDLPQLITQIPTVGEQRRLIKTLSRNSALLMKIRISPDTDVAALTAYWAKGPRAKDIQPLLESLTKVEGSISLDVAHLLPQFARKRLNTYPAPETSAGRAPPDCFWTAMNFFNDPPDDRFSDDAVWRKELAERYATVAQPTRGDLIFFLRSNDTPLHAAVYIADDVVFTKNGGNYRQPWLLMKIEDVLARYPQELGVKTLIFRAKEQQE